MPTSAPLLGGSAKSADVSDEHFAVEFNQHLVWHVVRNELLSRRQGTHKVKTRGEVSGGGAKPWRQKGTGRARQGTTRAPQWTGGGVVFGPTPRKYGGKVNRKERRKALQCALSVHAQRGSLAVLANEKFDAPSTKEAKALRAGLVAGDPATKARKLLVVCTLDQEGVYKSFRNLDHVAVVPSSDLQVADVLWGRSMIVTQAALDELQGVLSNG